MAKCCFERAPDRQRLRIVSDDGSLAESVRLGFTLPFETICGGLGRSCSRAFVPTHKSLAIWITESGIDELQRLNVNTTTSPLPHHPGNHVVSAGTKVMATSTASSGHRNGRRRRTTAAKGRLATRAVTNRTMPTGGVMVPIIRFSTTTTPNWIGSIPRRVRAAPESGSGSASRRWLP